MWAPIHVLLQFISIYVYPGLVPGALTYERSFCSPQASNSSRGNCARLSERANPCKNMGKSCFAAGRSDHCPDSSDSSSGKSYVQHNIWIIILVGMKM